MKRRRRAKRKTRVERAASAAEVEQPPLEAIPAEVVAADDELHGDAYERAAAAAAGEPLPGEEPPPIEPQPALDAEGLLVLVELLYGGGTEILASGVGCSDRVLIERLANLAPFERRLLKTFAPYALGDTAKLEAMLKEHGATVFVGVVIFGGVMRWKILHAWAKAHAPKKDPEPPMSPPPPTTDPAA